MSPDLVERVADRLHAAAHPYREGALDTKASEYRLRWHKAARYALALAERAAREAIVCVDDDWHIQTLAEAAVKRAVEGA